TGAVVAARATNALGVVVDLVVTLVVEHRFHTEQTMEELDAVRHRQLVLRHGVAEVRSGIAHGDFAQCGILVVLDDSVVILVAVAQNRLGPPTVERVSLSILERGAQHDRRYAAQAHELVGVSRSVERDVPAVSDVLDRYQRDQRLPTLVAHMPEVLETCRGSGAERRRQNATDECVLGLLAVVRDLAGYPA